MSVGVLLLVIAEGLIAVFALWGCWYLSRELDLLHGSHARPRDVPPGPDGTSARRMPQDVETPAAAGGAPGAVTAWSIPAAPGGVPRRPQTSLLSPAAAHAQAMWEASEPYLPPPPVRADLPVQRTPTADHAPWTGAQPALDEAALAELDREHYIASHLREALAAGTLTAGYMRDVMEVAPVYGQAPVARVLEAEAMQP